MATRSKFVSFVIFFFMICFFAVGFPGHAEADKDNYSNGKSDTNIGKKSKVPVTATVSGTVKEIVSTDADTVFLHIDSDGDGEGDTWVAIFQSYYAEHQDAIALDGHVDLQPGMVRENYHVKLLNKNVKRIVLSPGLAGQP